MRRNVTRYGRTGSGGTLLGVSQVAERAHLAKSTAILAFSDAATRDAVLAVPVPRPTPRTVVNRLHLRAALDRFQASGIAEDSEGTVLGARCVAAHCRPVGSHRTDLSSARWDS